MGFRANWNLKILIGSNFIYHINKIKAYMLWISKP